MSNAFRHVVDEETMSAGVKRQRALTLIEKLYHRDGAISFQKYDAANILREQIMAEMPPSEGVSSYGANIKATEPSRKSDRFGRRFTGFEVQPDGALKYPGNRRSRANMRELEDALFAACGVHDREGRRMVNLKEVALLMRIVTDAERHLTQTAITLELTSYYGAKSKQTPPYALGWIDTVLGRLAQHYGLLR